MKCPTCALTNGEHDRACWQEQVALLKSALQSCLDNIDPYAHEHFDSRLATAAKYASKNLALAALRETRVIPGIGQ